MMEMLASGELDAVFTSFMPTGFFGRGSGFRQLLRDFRAAERAYYDAVGYVPGITSTSQGRRRGASLAPGRIDPALGERPACGPPSATNMRRRRPGCWRNSSSPPRPSGPTGMTQGPANRPMIGGFANEIHQQGVLPRPDPLNTFSQRRSPKPPGALYGTANLPDRVSDEDESPYFCCARRSLRHGRPRADHARRSLTRPCAPACPRTSARPARCRRQQRIVPALRDRHRHRAHRATKDISDAVGQLLGVNISTPRSPACPRCSPDEFGPLPVRHGTRRRLSRPPKANDFVDWASEYVVCAEEKGNPKRIMSLETACGKKVSVMAGGSAEKVIKELSHK